MPEQEYQQWVAVYNQAATTINGRGEALDKAAELIERDLFLLGATAIEDKLQDGVPDTIHTLQMAGIKVCCVCNTVMNLSHALVRAGLGAHRRSTRDCNQYRHVVQTDFRIYELGKNALSCPCSVLSFL